MALTQTLQEILDQQKKAIPSQVFFNHFFAISFHICYTANGFDLSKTQYYNSLRLKKTNLDLDVIRNLLWNSWSTEYAFLLTNLATNDEYYKFALHWNFPQAYYSIYLAMTAFHET
jgi:hypothetical protein